MTIIVDTREQLPLFKKDVERCGLLCGDYTTPKLKHCFVVERKSPMDLYGSITRGHVRFRNELIRAAFNEIRITVVVECDKEEFITLQFPGAHRLQMKAETIEKIVNTFEKRYKQEFVWCSSREMAKRYVVDRLKKEERKLKKRR